MNNASAYPNVFGADAQCGAKPSGYKQVKKTVTNPAGAQTGASVTCPTGTVVLSGGVATSADSPGSWVTAMIPASSTKFHGANYNGTGASENFSVIAICAKKPPGYVIVGGSSTFSGPGTFAPNEICPSGTTGLFAGVSTNSTNPIEIPIVDSNNYDLLAFVNATYPGSITIQHKGICVS